jgi:conjugative transfer region protein TrbK
MKSQTLALAIAAAAFVPSFAPAQSVDQLLADHALLNSELQRCKGLGMASVDDARCKTARQAENKRFFGSGTIYTDKPVLVYPDAPVPDLKPNPPDKKRPNG